jgi:anti-sigma factor RsiW
MMNLQNDTLRLNAFVDGELDLASQLEIEAQLRDDAGLRRQVDEIRQLQAAVRERGDYHAAPAEFRARMTTLLAPKGEAATKEAATKEAPPLRPPAAKPSLADGLRQWLSWRPLAASMSLVLVGAVALNVVWLQASREGRLSEDVVASHVRSTLGQHLVDVASSDHHTVKPFLSARLGFSPPVDELRIPGSTFLGGRVDYLEGRPVAALVYKQGEHIVNAFVWPTTASDSSPNFAEERGFRTAHWSHNGMTHWVISDVNGQEFDTLVKAIRQLDAAR